MRYYPVNLDVRNKNCLVVGGGGVGTRKAIRLADCGARVTVVSREFTERLEALGREGRVVLKRRDYGPDDLDGVFLVFISTDNDAVNRKVAGDASAVNILCNVADAPDLCDFVLPSVVERGDLMLTVSTAGKSPAFSKKIRMELEKQFGEEYALFLRIMGNVRKKMLAVSDDPDKHKAIFEKLISGGLLEMCVKPDKIAIDRLVNETLGDCCSFNLPAEPEI